MTTMPGKQRSTKQLLFKLGVAVLGLSLIGLGYGLLSAKEFNDFADFAAGFLLMTGIQMFCWVIGIRLQILGNVTDDPLLESSDSEATQGTSAIPQH